jgi:hypothetical protein
VPTPTPADTPIPTETPGPTAPPSPTACVEEFGDCSGGVPCCLGLSCELSEGNFLCVTGIP